MEFVSARDLRLNPKKVWKRLGGQTIGVVTINGQPSFLLTKVNAAELEEIILIQNRIRTELALSKLRDQAASKNLDKMTSDEIDRIIESTRQKRQK